MHRLFVKWAPSLGNKLFYIFNENPYIQKGPWTPAIKRVWLVKKYRKSVITPI